MLPTNCQLGSLDVPLCCMSATQWVPCLCSSVSGRQASIKGFDSRQVFYSRASEEPLPTRLLQNPLQTVRWGCRQQVPTEASESFKLWRIYLFIHICLFAYCIFFFSNLSHLHNQWVWLGFSHFFKNGGVIVSPITSLGIHIIIILLNPNTRHHSLWKFKMSEIYRTTIFQPPQGHSGFLQKMWPFVFFSSWLHFDLLVW